MLTSMQISAHRASSMNHSTGLRTSAAQANQVHFSGLLPSRGVSRQFGSTTVKIKPGSITNIKCDAYVIPQFRRAGKFPHTSVAVSQAGAKAAIEAYNPWFEAYQASHGGEVPPIGTAHLVPCEGQYKPSNRHFKAKSLIHVASVATREPSVAAEASMYNALKEAKNAGLHTVAAPALSTGDVDGLPPFGSAIAMLKGIRRFAEDEPGYPMTVFLAPYAKNKSEQLLANYYFESALEGQR